MYISNVRNVIFFFSRFFLKKRREIDIFSGKTNFKIKKEENKPFSPLSPSSLSIYPSFPGTNQKMDYLVKNVRCQT